MNEKSSIFDIRKMKVWIGQVRKGNPQTYFKKIGLIFLIAILLFSANTWTHAPQANAFVQTFPTAVKVMVSAYALAISKCGGIIRTSCIENALKGVVVHLQNVKKGTADGLEDAYKKFRQACIQILGSQKCLNRQEISVYEGLKSLQQHFDPQCNKRPIKRCVEQIKNTEAYGKLKKKFSIPASKIVFHQHCRPMVTLLFETQEQFCEQLSKGFLGNSLAENSGGSKGISRSQATAQTDLPPTAEYHSVSSTTEAGACFAEQYEQWIKKLSEAQIAAIRRYTDYSFDINAYARGEKEYFSSETQLLFNTIVSGINQPIARATALYRRVSPIEINSLFQGIKKPTQWNGKTITYKQIISTSVVRGAYKGAQDQRDYEIVFQVPAGTKTAPVFCSGKTTVHTQEYEVLLKPGAYRVVHVEQGTPPLTFAQRIRLPSGTKIQKKPTVIYVTPVKSKGTSF